MNAMRRLLHRLRRSLRIIPSFRPDQIWYDPNDP